MTTTPPLATADDVRVEIDTELTDTQIVKILERIVAATERAYVEDGAADDGEAPYPTLDAAFDDDMHRIEFESVATAYRIATGRDRRARVESGDTFRTEYETDVAPALAARRSDLDPGDEFAAAGDAIHYSPTGRVIEQERKQDQD